MNSKLQTVLVNVGAAVGVIGLLFLTNYDPDPPRVHNDPLPSSTVPYVPQYTDEELAAKDAYKEAYDKGYSDGRNDISEDEVISMYDAGYYEGFIDGKFEGYEDGRNDLFHDLVGPLYDQYGVELSDFTDAG